MSRLVFCVPLVALALAGGFLASVSFAADDDELAGRELFTRKWVAHDKRSGLGDGLGPMHNATSCAACHEQGGPGGGGGRQHNVDLLSVLPVKKDDHRFKQEEFEKKLIAIHPGFDDGKGRARANFVLHRFGPEADYYALRAKVLGVEEPQPDEYPARRAVMAAALARRQAKEPSHIETLTQHGITLQRTQRNTPALWGTGLIDSIPDFVLQQLAADQAKQPFGVSGRVPPASEGGTGRFGWRGQTATLREFVLAACANELGLQAQGHLQAANPLAPHYKGPAEDLSGGDIDKLVLFIANLPQPDVRQPRNQAERLSLRSGERVFERIGCSGCHVHTVGRVEGLFSDLLLHDMGPMFDDPVEPNPEIRTVERKNVATVYSGAGRIFVDEQFRTPELPQEWRTPPLWGVADSAPYLHDGRADTLSEAIQLHNGEAAPATRNYRQLSGDDRSALHFFLESLVAPRKGPGKGK